MYVLPCFVFLFLLLLGERSINLVLALVFSFILFSFFVVAFLYAFLVILLVIDLLCFVLFVC